MTKEEILAMEAERKLDATVGWEIFKELVHSDMVHIEEGIKAVKAYPNYSTDISAAWQVLKKLREEYWCIEIKIADGCRVIMELLRTPPIRVEINAGTPFDRLSEAICKAALLAKLEAG